ncbi:hypothetical protein LZ575_17650 [Antarcticibacterium sp. 1MA-6-2]|uniref:hypothetical protein n=1 Tax=Antarcticibacterium sp. 1MA-6-2 TaxID=2908210 RepID=UPI001F2AC6D2|nr:hypothetical protein [Antarcticibacterium sp. 1MA-6-2]UJH90589.1 hypothetical protein LZ575_17650 [Antarcticibacterium sp. 1MA-6-2]
MSSNKIKPKYFILLLLLGISCKSDTPVSQPQEEEVAQIPSDNTTSTNLNISILLDLSDRINPDKYPNPAMEYYQRDVAYVKSVSDAFESHLGTKKVRQINDNIQLFFEPEPLNKEINSISETLKYKLTKMNVSNEILAEFSETYKTEPLKIYELAIQDDKFIGSDTWKFFKNKVQDYSIEEGYRNILVILTDGYMFHKDTRITEGNKTSFLTPEYIRSIKLNSSNWKQKFEDENFGFIPAAQNLDNLEVLVLGINPDTKNVYEEEIIKNFWSDWFQQMGVARYEIKNADLPSNMDKIIQDFILKT